MSDSTKLFMPSTALQWIVAGLWIRSDGLRAGVHETDGSGEWGQLRSRWFFGCSIECTLQPQELGSRIRFTSDIDLKSGEPLPQLNDPLRGFCKRLPSGVGGKASYGS